MVVWFCRMKNQRRGMTRNGNTMAECDEDSEGASALVTNHGRVDPQNRVLNRVPNGVQLRNNHVDERNNGSLNGDMDRPETESNQNQTRTHNTICHPVSDDDTSVKILINT